MRLGWAVTRIEKVKEMRKEWDDRMRVESERKVERERMEKLYGLRRCKQMVWECVERCMDLSEMKQTRLEKSRLQYEAWYEKREKRKKNEINNIIEDMIGSVIYKVSERNMRRVMLLELEEKWREKTDREIVRLSENHILLKRKHSRKKKYRIREKCRSPEKETTETTIKEKITGTRVQIVIQREKREMSKDKERERSLEKEIESEKVGGVRKKVVSPNIQKIREVFEKSEKVIPEKEKKGEKVSRLRNGFELMMDDTETRKKKFEMKIKRNKIVSLKRTLSKSTIDKWVEGG